MFAPHSLSKSFYLVCAINELFGIYTQPCIVILDISLTVFVPFFLKKKCYRTFHTLFCCIGIANHMGIFFFFIIVARMRINSIQWKWIYLKWRLHLRMHMHGFVWNLRQYRSLAHSVIDSMYLSDTFFFLLHPLHANVFFLIFTLH